jgi:tetratricopeptide (TPR) repeat protein
MSQRVEALKAMLAEDPKNSFARYGLAMEHVKTGELEAAVDEFRALLDSDPNYAAAYFHSGQAFERMGRVEDARAMYELGIEITTRSGDAHARSELQGALDLLPL